MHYGERKESQRNKMLELLNTQKTLREYENAHVWSLL